MAGSIRPQVGSMGQATRSCVPTRSNAWLAGRDRTARLPCTTCDLPRKATLTSGNYLHWSPLISVAFGVRVPYMCPRRRPRRDEVLNVTAP